MPNTKRGVPPMESTVTASLVLMVKSKLVPALKLPSVGTATDDTVGATSSTVIARPDDAEDILPAASVANTENKRPPADNADEVIDQLPPVAVALPSTVEPTMTKSDTVLPASA